MKKLQCGELLLDLSTPQVMGILNVTPDSFSDGGKFNCIDNALYQAEKMITDGASIIDIGGESTRPGAADVSLADELERVIPVLEAIKSRLNIIVSIDTSKAEVMSASINSGAGIINDVRALQNPDCLSVVAKSEIPVCLMHMQGLPRTMQTDPQYDDLFGDIFDFFTNRINACEKQGIDRNRIILDPGFGFGKTLEQNYQLLAGVDKFRHFNLPVLAGLSRKSMIGNLLERGVDERLAGSLSAAIISVQQGAKIIRVHDVKETVDAIKIVNIVNENKVVD